MPLVCSDGAVWLVDVYSATAARGNDLFRAVLMTKRLKAWRPRGPCMFVAAQET